MTTVLTSLLAIIPLLATAGTGNWSSPALGKNITYTTSTPSKQAKDAAGKSMTVVYLENLGYENISTVSNADNVQWLKSQGYTVIELNYGGDAKAVSPGINQDIISINEKLNGGSFCGVSGISNLRAYILMEGYRIRRDVPYYLDDKTVYNLYNNEDSLYMDIVYPAEPKQKVPTILSFSYANSYDGKEHQRMFLGYTLQMFKDSFLEGAPARGMAWAIADHPKYCDWGNGKYKGGANKSLGSCEVNPDAARKVKSAIRTVRGEGAALGLDGNIFVFGFSRGSTAASLAIGDAPFQSWLDTTRGRYPEQTSDIQAAILGPGVFDYNKMSSASNEYKRMTEFCKNGGNSAEQGGALAIKNTACPTFLFYNSDDDANYKTQANNLISIFDAKGVRYETLIDFSTGHAIPQKAEELKRMYDFLQSNVSSGITKPTIVNKKKRRKGVFNLRGHRVSSEIDSLPHGVYIADGRKMVR